MPRGEVEAHCECIFEQVEARMPLQNEGEVTERASQKFKLQGAGVPTANRNASWECLGKVNMGRNLPSLTLQHHKASLADDASSILQRRKARLGGPSSGCNDVESLMMVSRDHHSLKVKH